MKLHTKRNPLLACLDEVQEELLYYPSVGVGVGIGVGGGVGVSKKFNVKVFYVMGKALSGELSCLCDRSCSFITCVFQLSSFTLHSMPDVWKDPIPSLISVFQDEQSSLDVSLKMMNVCVP